MYTYTHKLRSSAARNETRRTCDRLVVTIPLCVFFRPAADQSQADEFQPQELQRHEEGALYVAARICPNPRTLASCSKLFVHSTPEGCTACTLGRACFHTGGAHIVYLHARTRTRGLRSPSAHGPPSRRRPQVWLHLGQLTANTHMLAVMWGVPRPIFRPLRIRRAVGADHDRGVQGTQSKALRMVISSRFAAS